MAAVLYLKEVLELASVPYVYASFSTPSEVDCSRLCILNETCYRYWSSVSRDRSLWTGNTGVFTTTTTTTITTAPTTTSTPKTTTTTTSTTTAPTTTSNLKTTTTTTTTAPTTTSTPNTTITTTTATAPTTTSTPKTTTTTTTTTTAPTTTSSPKTTTTTTKTAPTTTSIPKTTITTTADKVRTSHGIVCKQKQDCRIKKSVCYRGVCLCILGFYFSPKRNACLRACDEYGDGMDIYKGAAIKDHNDKRVNATTLTSCLDLCVREKAFTCLSVDWRNTDGHCCLSTTGYRDVIFWGRQRGLRDNTFGQRRCK